MYAIESYDLQNKVQIRDPVDKNKGKVEPYRLKHKDQV